MAQPEWLLSRLAVRSLVLSMLVSVILLVGVGESWPLTHPEGYPDPFMSYAALMSGPSAPTPEEHHCDTQLHDIVSRQKVCQIHFQTGSFKEVDITTCDCDAAQREIAFWSDTLTAGELVLRWGRPETITRNSTSGEYLLVWTRVKVEAYTVATEQFSYQSIVELTTWSL